MPRLRLPSIASALVPLAAAAIVAGLTIRHSLDAGRLRTYPVVDNVNYMSSGLSWLQAVQTGGLPALIRLYVQQPPHSPYTTTSIFLAYSLAGISDVAVHAFQSLALAVALGWLWFRPPLARTPLWLRLTLLALLAAMPFWQWSIEVAKPDYLASVLTICGGTLLLRRPAELLPRGTWFAAGLLCGGAILAKPMAFPGTLFAFACIALGRLVAGWIGQRGRTPRVAWVLPAALTAGLGCLLVAGPHFAVAWRGILYYIRQNLYGERSDQWVLRGSLLDQWTYYLVGGSGQVMLGRMLLPTLAVLATGLVFSFVFARREGFLRLWWAETAAWTIALAGPYALAAANPMKIREFGLNFQLLLVFAAAHAAAAAAIAARRQPARSRPVTDADSKPTRAGWLICAAMIVVIAVRSQWMFGLDTPEERALTDARTQLAHTLFNDLRALQAARTPPATLDLRIVGSPSHLGSPLLSLWIARAGANIRTTGIYSFKDTRVDRALAPADAVLAHETRTRMARDRGFPGVDDAFVEYLLASPNWKLHNEYPSPHTGRRFLLFTRTNPRPQDLGDPGQPTTIDAEETEP